MTRQVTIELPDTMTVNGMNDAPDSLRVINTANWNADFCLTAMFHGVSQKQGDAWSVTKKDVEKTQKVHDTLVAGDWSTKSRTGATAVKFDNAIKALNAEQLFNKLTREQLFELAKLAKADAK
jgi:hypothetical protein